MKILVAIVSLMLVVGGLGCMALSDYVTPSLVDKNAVDYVYDSGIRDSGYYEGYQNLDKANRLVVDVDNAHESVQLDLQQQSEKDSLTYSRHRDVVTVNRQTAVKREELLFGETGILSMGLSMLGAGGFAGLLGLMRKRPGDLTPQDFETAVASVKGEVNTKDRQLIDLVRGVQAFIKTYPEDERKIKDVMDREQDSSTQIEVAKIRASL